MSAVLCLSDHKIIKISHCIIKEYAIIYITEGASLKAKESLAKYKDMELPAIIVIPGIGGSMGLGMNEVRESAKRAIGADILFSE